MSKNRITFSDDVVLTSGNVGINTGLPGYKLEVNGTVYSTNDFRVTGDATLTGYDGFLKNQYTVDESISLSSAGQTNTLSQETIVPDDVTVTAPSGSTAGSTTLKTIKLKDEFTIPVGDTEDRPTTAKKGELRYNKDFASVEFWDGNVWRQVDNTTRSGRGVFGSDGTYGYVNISTLGNAEYFGDALYNAQIHGSFGSETRGIWGGGYGVTGIEYVTLSSSGNGISFGDLTSTYFRNSGGCSSSTRGLFFGGGLPAYYNVIEYIQIQTTGNALDFGDQTNGSAVKTCFSSPTRGFSIGGYSGAFGASLSSTIDAVTISSKGDAIDFGDIKQRRIGMAGLSNNVRGVFGGGYNTPSYNIKGLEYITLSSNGNGTDFGDLTQGRTYPGGTSTQTRGIIFGGALVSAASVSLNTIDYITIASTGNAQDFGDFIKPQTRMRGTSDSHGGLGGF